MKIVRKGRGIVYGCHLTPYTNYWKQTFFVRKWYFLQAFRSDTNYRMVGLCSQCHKTKMKIGALNLSAFVGDRPTPTHQLDHRNQNKDSDSVENICWLMSSENRDPNYRDPFWT